MLDKKNIKNILLLPPCGLGDFINYFSYLKAIRNHYPQAKIYMLTAGNGRAVKELSFVDNVEIIERPDDLNLIEKLKFVLLIRKLNIDLAVVRAPSSPIIPMVALLSGARIRIGPAKGRLNHLYTKRADISSAYHIKDIYGLILQEANIEIDTSYQNNRITVTQDIEMEAEEKLHSLGIDPSVRIIGFVSGADTKKRGKWMPQLKKWKIDNYVQVAASIKKEKGFRLAVFGNRSESIVAENIARLANMEILNFCGNTSMTCLLGLIKKCSAILCNDTAIMHIADALGIPVVALFGPTDPKMFGPLGRKSHVLQGKDRCSPCYPNPSCNASSCSAMQSISPEEVINKLSLILE